MEKSLNNIQSQIDQNDNSIFVNENAEMDSGMPNEDENKDDNQSENQQFEEEVVLSRKIEFDKGIQLNYDYASNEIKTIPYSIKNFILFVWNNFSNKPFNIFLLFLIFILVLFKISCPQDFNSTKYFSLTFIHITLILIQIIISIGEYIICYVYDYYKNGEIANVYSPKHKKFIKKIWGEIKVGNIIRVDQDNVVPADLILLEVMDLNHQCFVDYSSLSGYFDSFEIKKACKYTHAPTMKKIKFNEYIKNIKGFIKCEEPNGDLESFRGKLKLDSFPRSTNITNENFILRGCTIKNAKWIYGIVVYAGNETKIMQIVNKTEKRASYLFSKKSNNNYKNISLYNHSGKNELNNSSLKADRGILATDFKIIEYMLIIVYFVMLLLMVLVNLHKAYIIYASNKNKNKDQPFYLYFYYNNDYKNSPFHELFICFIAFALSLHFVLPFNWFGLNLLIYDIQKWFIKRDANIVLPNKKLDDCIEIINKNTLPNFGNVQYILTDKTGTLTQRKFKLKACSIQGIIYPFEHESSATKESFLKEKTGVTETEIYKILNDENDRMSDNIYDLFQCVTLCHSVKVSNSIDNNKDIKLIDNDTEKEILLNSCYAEEKAALKMMRKFGFKVIKTLKDSITIETPEGLRVFTINAHNKFSIQRNRMSILMTHNTKNENNENTSQSILYVKANDISVLNLLEPMYKNKHKMLIDKIKLQIEKMTEFGHRYFILCKRVLDNDECTNLVNKFKSAENCVVKREEMLMNVANNFEQNLKLVGVLFFVEKVPLLLKSSIERLRKNQIKVWIVSGDRRENVLAVGRTLGLHDENNIIADFKEGDKQDNIDITMSNTLMQFLFPDSKIRKLKIAKRDSIDSNCKIVTSIKELTIILNGECFNKICNDKRSFQSMAVLLTYCTNLFGYQFSPRNKYILCKMLKTFCTKNCKVLAVGDGFNDFSMLKEADLSIGIKSREILQVKTSCDIIVDNFCQIPDLILVHGVWNFMKLFSISIYGFYTNLLLTFPVFLHQNSNPIGSSFYNEDYFTLSINMVFINLGVIIILCFDTPIDRCLLNANNYIYTHKMYNKEKLFITFFIHFVKGGIDSLLIYYLFFINCTTIINQDGMVINQNVLGYALICTQYAIIIIKLFIFNLNSYNFIQLLVAIIVFLILTLTAIIVKDIGRGLLLGFTFVHVFMVSLISISISILYEAVARQIIHVLSENFSVRLLQKLKKYLNKNNIIVDFEGAIKELEDETPNRTSNAFNMKNGITQKPKSLILSYPEILEKIHDICGHIDPSLESMADTSNEEVARIKVKKPFVEFMDKKLEENYIDYESENIKWDYIGYLCIVFAFWIIDIFVSDFKNQIFTKVIKLVYNLFSFILLITPLRRKFFKYLNIIFLIIVTIEIVCVYVEKEDNDTKLYFQMFYILSFPLLSGSKNFLFTLLTVCYYALGITPAIYLNSFGFDEKTNDPDYILNNLSFFFNRNTIHLGNIFMMLIFAYYNELGIRVDYLKYHKSKEELKKDNQIMANLVPNLVREQMINGTEANVSSVSSEEVTILFCDIQDFEKLNKELDARELVSTIDKLWSQFDRLCLLHGLQKIETVFKTYMAAGGIKKCEKDIDKKILEENHGIRSFEFAVDILDVVQKVVLTNKQKIKVKIGLHTGTVIAAIVGNHKKQFSLIGDTVNTSARMCTNNRTTNAITCSEYTYNLIKNKYLDLSHRVAEIKGKGKMNLYSYEPVLKGRYAPKKSKMGGGDTCMDDRKLKSKISGLDNFNSFGLIGNRSSRRHPSISFNKNDKENSILILENSMSDLMMENNDKSLTKNVPTITIHKSLEPTNKDKTKKEENNTKNNKNNSNKNTTSQAVESNNIYYDDSYWFIYWKNQATKFAFEKFEDERILKNIDKTMLLTAFFIIIILIGIYFNSQFSLLSENHINIIIIVNGFFMVILVGLFYLTKRLMTEGEKYTKFISYSYFGVFITFPIVSLIKYKLLNQEFYLNITLDTFCAFAAIQFFNIFSYKLLSLYNLAHIILYIINLAINHNSDLIVKYSIFVIFLTIYFQLINIFSYYKMSMLYYKNQKVSQELESLESMLFNIIPVHVVRNMKDDIPVCDEIDNVTILYSDIVNFTKFSASKQPEEVVYMLSELFKKFDDATITCKVYKVHTIGDCYVAMGFAGKVSKNARNIYTEAYNVCKLGEKLIKIIEQVRQEPKVNFPTLNMRIGIHTGKLIAGIVGSSVVRYDIFGIDSYIANKMESSGVPGKIHISESTKKILEKINTRYTFAPHEEVTIESIEYKDKTYILERNEQ